MAKAARPGSKPTAPKEPKSTSSHPALGNPSERKTGKNAMGNTFHDAMVDDATKHVIDVVRGKNTK